jgi:tetratricopeptide (TPR) repeat protein
VLDELGGALVQRGQLTEALAAFESAREIYSAAGAAADVARCDHNAGAILADLGRIDDGLARFRVASEEYCAALEFADGAVSLRAIADLLAIESQPAEALAALLGAAGLHDDAGETVRAALDRVDAADLLLSLDRDDEAAELLMAARATLRSDGALLWVARADHLHAELDRRRGDSDAAFARIEAARAVYDAAGMDDERDRCDDLWCAVLVDAGYAGEAVERLEQARRSRQADGDAVGVAWCDLHLSRAHQRLGNPERAGALRRQARAVFDAAGLDSVLRSRELAAS